MTITVLELLKEVAHESIRDVRRILAHTKGVSYEFLMFYPEKVTLNHEEQQKFEEFLERYRKLEPISKIIERKNFWKDEFFVNGEVLDPRPETELIIEGVLERCRGKMSPKKILDIGTGSGCILLSILREFPEASGIGIDISRDAIEVAERNRKELGINEGRARFLNIGWNDLRQAQYQKELRDVDIIVSNPPYIRTADIAGLDENVRKYDPMVALDGGADGLHAYREICAMGREILADRSARIFLEVGYDQADEVARILEENGFKEIAKIRDLAGIERVVCGVSAV